MNTTEILIVIGCAVMFVVLGLLTKDRPANLLLRAGPHGPEDDCEADTSRCGGCAHPCETSERDDA